MLTIELQEADAAWIVLFLEGEGYAAPAIRDALIAAGWEPHDEYGWVDPSGQWRSHPSQVESAS